MDIRKRFQQTKRNTALSNYYYSIRQENEYRNALNKIAEERAKQKIEDEKRNLLKKQEEEKKKEEEAAQAKKNTEWQRQYVTVPSHDLPASRIPSKDAGRKARANIDRSVFDKWLHTDQVWEPVKKQQGNINFNIYPNPETGSFVETNTQRQITRSNLQKKGNELTEEEKDYYRTTSPEFMDGAAKLWEAFERNQENEKDLKDFATGMKIMESVRYGFQPTANPIDYTSSLIAGNGSIDPNSIAGQALQAAQDYNAINQHLDDQSYVKDAYSKYQQDRLLAEIGAQGGIITRNKENALRADRIQQFADLTNEYIDVYNQLGQLPIGRRQERSQLINRLSQIEAQRAKLTPLIKQDVSYDLGGNETSNIFNAAYGVTQSRNQYESMSISGLGKMLLQYDLSDPNTDRDTVKKLISALSVNNKRYKQQMGVENKNALAEGNLKYKELEQYRKWHMPSKDFLEKAQAAQENKLSDIDTYLYSMPGTLGSSASYWKTQAVATGLMFAGSALVQSKSAATAATGLGLVATGAGIQFLSGANENNAEVSSNWQQGFQNELVVKGLFDKFIKDGRHKLAKKGINAPTDQDVLDNYTLGNFKSDNDQVENIAEKYIYGANNLFKQDMMATTADVAFSAGLSIFAPGSKYARFVKFKPIGTDRTAALSRLYRMKGMSEGAANRVAAAVTGATSESTTAGVLGTVASPLEYAYRGVKGGVAASSSRAAGLIQKLDSRITALTDWTKAVPAKLLAKDAAKVGETAALRSVRHAANAGTVGRHVLQFAERQAAQAMSEGIEEGKQYENGKRYANREYAGSSRSMARVLIDDIGTGVNVGFQFLGNQFGIFDADKDLMANMRGGFLGGLMNLQNGVSVAVSDVRGTIRDVSANDFLYHNLLAEKYGGRSTIENGRQFARYANRQSEMSEAFDRFQSIMDVQASKGEAAFTKEDIDEQRNQFNRISKIVNNKWIREIAKNSEIEVGSNEFNTLVSIYNWADQNLYENAQALKDALEEQKKLGYHSRFGINQSTIDSAIENIFGVNSNLSKREQELVNEAEDAVRTVYLEKYHRDPTDEELEKGVRDALQRHDSWNNGRDMAVMRYYALQQLIQNLDSLKNNPSTKDEFEKHRTKYKYYKNQLDNLRKGLFKDDINHIDSSTDSFSAARAFVENDDMFDNVVDSIRQIIQLESQVNDSASIISDLFGISIMTVNKTYRENLLSGVIDSRYARSAMNDEEISDELANLTATLDSFSRRVKAQDKKDRKAKRKDLVSQYLNGITQDEEFTEQINRDFRQYHEAQEEKAEFFERARREGKYMTEDNSLEEEEAAEFDYSLHEEAKRRRDDFLGTIKDDKKRDRTLVDLSSDEQIDTAEDVHSNGYTVRDVENDDFTYNGQVIPVGDNIVKVAERPDGSLIPLTQGQVDYINYLNSVNNQSEESVTEESPTLNPQPEKIDNIKEYEDQISDAILKNDRETFDKLTSLISPFVDEDYMKMLDDMWNEARAAQVPTKQADENQVNSETDITIAINDVLSKFNTIIALATKYNNIIQEVIALRASFQDSPEVDIVFQFTLYDHPDNNGAAYKELDYLNTDVGGITRGEKVQVFIKAGFKFEDRPKAKVTWYYAVSPQGDEYRISKVEYKLANFILNQSSTGNVQKKSYTVPFSSTGYNVYAEGFKERYAQRNYPPIEPTRWYKQQPKTDPSGDVQTTQAQRDTLNAIESFRSDSIRNVRKDLTTGMDYFIVIDGELTRISRVHSYLHPQYGWGQKETQDYENRRKQLYDLAEKEDTRGLKNLIIQWQTEVNQYIQGRYGKDSLEYKQFAINLLPYVNCGYVVMLDRESLDHIASITHYKMDRSGKMVPSCVINRSVIGGTIIDDLCRRFFAGEAVEYSDDLMMSKETFDALIKQLTVQRDLFKNRGWVISTTPYTWHGRLADGRLIAGETDMIAVDKDGHIHIIDFKTSKRSFDQLQYKNNTELGGTQWEDVIDGVDYTSKETRHVSHALDDKVGTQKLTAREHYAEQQTHYLNMVRQCLGDRMADDVIVDDASLLVFQVRTKAVVMPNETRADVNAFGGFVDSGQSTLVYNDDRILNNNKAGVALQGVIELTFDENVSKLYNKRQDEDLSDMLAAMDRGSEQLDLHATQLINLYNENKDKLSDVLKKRVRDLAKSARSIPTDIQDPKVREDKQSIQNKSAQIVEAIRKTDELIEDIQKELEQLNNIQQPEVQQGHKLNPNLKTATGELANFDHLNFENPMIAVHPDLKRCSAYPDFLEHAVIEVDMSSLGSWFSVPNAVDCSVFVNIHYDEHLPSGQVVHHEWTSKNGRGIKLIPTQKSTNINITNSQLIRKINQLIHDPQNAGKRIVLTGASRTNGRVVYSGGSQAKSVKDAFNLSDSDLETLQTESAEGHQIGIVKGGGVAELQPASGNIKYVYSVNPNRRDAITGDLGALTDGVVTLIYNCGYNEDGGSRAHSIPIALTPKHLTGSDIDFIVSLLKNYRNRAKVTINGKQYVSPISNSRLLRTLVRFGQGAEQTNSRFIFDWANTDENGFSTDNYRTVRVALIDQKQPTNPDGSTNYRFDYTVDLTDEQAVKNVLIPTLKQNVYLYANNEQAMLHASVSSRDESNKDPNNAPMTNPFAGLERFIKANPELTKDNKDWEMKFSDSLIFRRSDIDPNLDGSNKGITGLHWMIKNGWLRTNFDHIELPLIAFTDAQVEENPNHPKNIDDQPTGPTTAVSEEPKQDNSPAQPRKRRRRKIDTSMIDDNGIEGMIEPKTKGKEGISRNVLNEERARKRIRKILGKSFKVVVDSLERVGMSANEALGLIGSDQTAIAYASKDAITLSDAVGNGEEFHEAFHIVMDLLVGEKRRKGIYERYKKNYFKKYGKHLSESQISENLADEYYNFRTKQYFKPSWNIIGSIFNAVTDWCQFLRNLGDYKLALVFVETNLGRYRIKSADPESIKSWEARNKNRGNIEPYTITLNNEKVNLEYFKSGREFDDAVNSILYQILKAYGIDQLGQNADKLQTDIRFLKDEDSLLYEVYLGLTQAEDEDGEITDQDIIDMRDDGEITVLQATNILKYREVFKHWNDAQRMLNDKLRAMGVYSKRERLEAEKEDNDAGEGTDASQDIKDHNDEFYTHARSEEIDAGIRFFLSTVPSVRWATQEDVDNGIVPSLYKTNRKGEQIVGKDGKPVRAVVPLAINSMGTVQFMPFNTVYQTLLKQLYDVKNIRDLLKRADNLGESDYLFYYVKKSFRSYLSKSYIRYGSKEDEKAYTGIPKVRYKDGYLSPNDYVVDLNNPTDEELNPNVVRWTHDVVENGIIVARKGDIIQAAEIITNPKFESITTQLYQAIKSQHLNYNFTYAYPVRDENGHDTGLRYYKEYGTNSQRDSYAYPILWFNLVRSVDDLFTRNEGGNYVVNKDSQLKKSLNQFKDFLYILKTGMAVNRRSRISIDGQTYNFDNDEDFNKIETLFIEKLNGVGIQISRYVLDHLLISKITTSQRKQDIFENMLTSQGNDSLAPFIDKNGILDKMIQAIDRGDVNFFIQDTNTRTTRTGSYLYSKNGFVISLAKALSDYKQLSSETMVVGPQNTKMYTFAQNHTASDVTDDINNTYDESGNIRKGSTMDDMKDVEYIVSTDEDESTIGSVIAKEVLKGPQHNRLNLHTYSGIRDTTNNDGGTKYSEITAREDALAKMNLLSDGAIIFPTLSDKSTYMYLTGIPLPGFDYHNGVNFAQLPKFKKDDRIFYQRADRVNNVAGDDVSYYYPNSVLDQMIEYALCEFKNVQKTIRTLHLDPNDTSDASIQDSQKVKNYHTGPSNIDAGYHGARFAFLSGIYDENGIYVSFNRYEKDEADGGVMSSYQLANNAFFSKSKEEQRAIIQRTLQHRLDELLADLVEKGIIYRVEENTTYHLKNGQRVKSQHSKYLGYANRYLDNSKIEYLANVYYANSNGKWNMDQCRSMAIVAFAQDVNNRSIMSLEEVERLFTGMPQFFMWKYNIDGDLIDRGEDESKRFGGFGSTGVNNRDDLPNLSEEYTCAEIKDQYVESSLSSTLTAAFEKDEYREALVNKKVREARSAGNDTDKALDTIYDEVYSDEKSLADIKNEFTEAEREIIDRKIKAEAKSYTGGINVADGTAYITDKMCENLLRQRGVFTKEVAEAFQYLRNQKAYERTKVDKNKKKVSSKFHEKNGYMTNAKAYHIIMEAQISTQKYSAFGYRMENGIPVHFYNKFALFPLFEGISYGFTRILYEKMTDKENPVDMVMFSSAVKAGSEGSQTFNPEMENPEEFSFAGRIYKQRYKYIRRQLNTDPKAIDDMAMGTQAVKVAFAALRDNQTYTTRDGRTVRGNDLKIEMMRLINDLATIGRERVSKEFFDDHGNVDIEKFSAFAKRELMSRNANKNLLDALDVVSNHDGTVRFKTALDTVSDMSWIESIINSYINKEIIDITLPGNAFYQRSIFGMEGIAKMQEDDAIAAAKGFNYTINNGNELQMINEQGSMDCVVSIDFFTEMKDENGKFVVPRSICDNFLKTRQWLIDQGIIGGAEYNEDGTLKKEGAKTLMMSYRIPTQAASSINPLRVVDVLPVIRDTIVLPKEFTALTGSDFKQTLKSLNFFNCWETQTK